MSLKSIIPPRARMSRKKSNFYAGFPGSEAEAHLVADGEGMNLFPPLLVEAPDALVDAPDKKPRLR